MNTNSHILNSQTAKEFIFAGKATITLRNVNSGNRFTYSINAPKKQDEKRPVYFVKVFTGTDNEKSYTFAGTLFGKFAYRHSPKSRLTADTKSVSVFIAFLNFLERETLPKDMEVYHEGKCGCCGKKLTTPESLISGFGPWCQARRWKIAQQLLLQSTLKS